jgi:hypothetical protein
MMSGVGLLPTPPRVASSAKQVEKNRQQMVLLKDRLLEENGKIYPNSKAYTSYKNKCITICQLTPFQFYCTIGLLLSDASIQLNAKGLEGRLKMQQTIKRKLFMDHLVIDVFPEYTFQKEALLVSQTRQNMVSFQTLTLPVFKDFASLFYVVGAEGSNVKIVNEHMARLLHPIALAYWFAGDGGKYEYHKRAHSGKGLVLNTQGFDEKSIDVLVNALKTRYNWNVVKVNESGATNQWWIKIKDYDDFIYKVGPYIHPTIISKLPSGRQEKSRFGSVTQAIRDQICGSFFTKAGQ